MRTLPEYFFSSDGFIITWNSKVQKTSDYRDGSRSGVIKVSLKISNMESKILTTELHDLEAGLTSYVHSLNLGNKEQSLVQETFLKAIMRYPKSNMNGYLKSWTGIIKRKAFINNYRNLIKQKPAKGLDDMFMIYHSESDYESDYKEIVQNIDHLDESLRKPFRMFVEVCTYSEIADATMLNIETVKTRILIARSQLMLQNG